MGTNLPRAERPLIAAGGPDASFSAAIKNIADPTPDALGRPILSDVRSPKPLINPTRSLADSHVFMALVLHPGKTCLFAGGHYNYKDYISFNFEPSTRFQFYCENQKDQLHQFSTTTKLADGQLALLEFHPISDGKSKFLINGQEVAQISSLQSLKFLFSGYQAGTCMSDLAEFRVYDSLSPEAAANVAFLMKSYWGIPGGIEVKNPTHFHSSAWLSPQSNAAVSDQLTLRLSSTLPTHSGILFYSSLSSESYAASPQDPSHLSIIAGKFWTLSPQSLPTPTTAHFSFNSPSLLPSDLLGNHGSYVLLHRHNLESPWSLVSESNPDPQGLVHFLNTPIAQGDYCLAIRHGLTHQPSASAIRINDQPSSTTTIHPGSPFTIKVHQPHPGQKLTLSDATTGLIWFHGPADQLKLTHRIFRQAETKLIAQFHTSGGFLAKRQDILLTLDPTSPRLYPGFLAQFIAKNPQQVSLPSSNDFIPKATWPSESGLIDTNYPAFRTSESFLPSPTPAKRPSYHHLVLPSLAISPDATTRTTLGTYTAYPSHDLDNPTRFSGFLIPTHTGPHDFSLTINQAAKLTINGKSTSSTAAATLMLQLHVATLQPIPFELITVPSPTNTPKDPPILLSSDFLWKTPDTTTLTRIPESAFFHPVEPARERALAQLSKQFAHRYTNFNHDLANLQAPTPLPAEKPEALQSLRPLVDLFLRDQQKAGEPALATAALALIHDRIAAIRSGKLPAAYPVFCGYTRGDDIAIYNAIQPFLFALENHPAYQQAALQARAEINSYLVSTIAGRSFFKEHAWGANDCYGVEHNFAHAIWKCAEFTDSPYAWDSACNLFDNQFHFCDNTGEGLYTDGTICFHNANARQMHLSGYGSAWLQRVGIAQFPHSPWSMSPEQFRRLTEYVLAFEWFLYQDTSSFIINGRHNSHQSPSHLASSIVKNLAEYLLSKPHKLFRPQDLQSLQAALQRIKKNPANTLQGNRFFFKNLATVHRSPEFFIEAKMISPLCGPNEAFAGYFPWNMGFGDCFTALLRHGNEYHDIHRNSHNAFFQYVNVKDPNVYVDPNPPKDLSLWHYAARPGLTQPDDESYKPDRYRRGSGTTAGGTSDGTLGSLGCEWNAKATHHFKFYAFTKDGFASLTTDITATDAKSLAPGSTYRTNLNQCVWTGPISITKQSGESITIPANATDRTLSFALDQRYLIQHDGIAYLILPTNSELAPNQPGTLDLALTTRTPLTPLPGYQPNAQQIALIKSTKLDQSRVAKVFHLSINHGTSPTQAQAAYYVCMIPDKANAAAFLQSPPIHILQNQPDLQALTDARDHTTHAFFRKPGQLNDLNGASLLKSDIPAVLMWRPDTHSLTAHEARSTCTSDVSQIPTQAKITLLGKIHHLTFPGTNQPDDRHHGKPVTIPIP